MTVNNIRHTGIVVSDMQRSLEFYRDRLGLEPVIDFTEEGKYIDTLTALEGVRLRMVKLVAKDGSMIELLQYLSHPQQESGGRELCEIGPTHLAFTVDDVEKVFADWFAKGVKCNCAPQLSPDGKAKLFFCQDPDGTFLEIVEQIESSS